MPLNHPNIVPLVAFSKERSFLISPLYEQGNIRIFLQKKPDLDHGHRLCLVLGIGEGVKYLHSADIIHSDLKPENVLIDNNIPRISDFGISQLLDTSGCTTASVGTQAYIAPELWRRLSKRETPITGAWTTKESDIFSFGIMALEVCVLRISLCIC
ncbi:putative Pto-like serine/threonine kinase [Mycena venus]|uniref:Putative Pto-like serine/threonine kinase n=1 Tax=Mycena venus TaxID=2733690 RepID=A0A8H6U3D6_9AGAR|nr:putative Pto-like serine/threonine kinase [Mycena venus]